MGMSLSEIRKSPHIGRPTRSHPVCLARTLTARWEELQSDADDLREERAGLTTTTGEDEGEPKANARIVDGPDERIAAIDERLAAIKSEQDDLGQKMAEHTGDVTVQAIPPNKWKQWVNEHPAREQGESGWRNDFSIVGGWCNSDDLIADLGKWAIAWNDEPLKGGEWEFIAENAPRGTLKQLAALVAHLHEEDQPAVPFHRTASSMTRSDADD